MTNEEVEDILRELFSDFEDTDYSEGMSFRFDGVTPLFRLEIKNTEGEQFTVVYRPPLKYLRRLIKGLLDTEKINDHFETMFAHQNQTLSNAGLLEFTETHKTAMFNSIAQRIEIMTQSFESVFRQAALDVPILWSDMWEAYFGKVREKIKNKFMSKVNKDFRHAAFEAPPFEVAEARNRFIKKHNQGGKKIAQQAFSILPADLPPRRFLFDPIYNHLLPVWQQAQRFYKDNKNKVKWREMLVLGFEEYNLPADLIDKLDSLDKIEKMPSSITLIHTARLCEINEDTAHRTLQLYRKESREWMKQSPPDKIEELMSEYKLPLDFHPNVINARPNELM